MANLTSLYCNKHLTVLVNVHVRPVLWSQPVQPSWGEDGCGCDSSLRWRRLLGCHALPPHPLVFKPVGQRGVGEGKRVKGIHRIAWLDLAIDWLGLKRKKGEVVMDNRGAGWRAVLWSTRRYYTDQVKIQFYTPGNADFQFILTL